MAESEEQEAKPAGGGKPLVWMALVGVVALLAGAGGTYFAVGGEDRGSEGAEASEAQAEPAPVPFSERVVPLEPFVVNVTGDEYPRFLKVTVKLEVEEPSQKQIVEDRMAQIRDSLIVLITSKRLSDVSDFEGKALLKQEILDRVNGLFDEPFVKSVLFTEFVVQ